MSKQTILNSIQTQLFNSGKENGRGRERLQAVKKRISRNPEHSIPARAQGSQSQLQQRFILQAKEAQADVICCKHEKEAIKKIIAFLQQHDIGHLRVDSSANISQLKWPEDIAFKLQNGCADITDKASLTSAVCAIAETGTLVLASSRATPTTLAFLPESHLVLLHASKVVGSYENAWEIVRRTYPDKLPRNVNMITGPSRSADIEQTLLMGAHGPKSLIIYLVDDEA